MSATHIEQILLAVVLFSGFTWLRRRSHLMDPEKRTKPILIGIFGLLPVFLLVEAKFLPLLPLTIWPLLVVKVLLLVLTFFAIGKFFVKP